MFFLNAGGGLELVLFLVLASEGFRFDLADAAPRHDILATQPILVIVLALLEFRLVGGGQLGAVVQRHYVLVRATAQQEQGQEKKTGRFHCGRTLSQPHGAVKRLRSEGKLVRIAGLEPANWPSASLLIVVRSCIYLLLLIRVKPFQCKRFLTTKHKHAQEKLWGTLGRCRALGNLWEDVTGQNVGGTFGAGLALGCRQKTKASR